MLGIVVNLRQKLQQQMIPHLENIDFSSPKLFPEDPVETLAYIQALRSILLIHHVTHFVI